MSDRSIRRRDTEARDIVGPGEIGILVFICVVLAALAIGERAGMQSRVAVRAAQSRLLDLHVLSQTIAAERGIPVRLSADPSSQTVTLEEGCAGGGRVLESRDFNLSYRVDMMTTGGAFTLCVTPNGYADPERSSTDGTSKVTFLRGDHSSSLVFSPLGQPTRP